MDEAKEAKIKQKADKAMRSIGYVLICKAGELNLRLFSLAGSLKIMEREAFLFSSLQNSGVIFWNEGKVRQIGVNVQKKI